MKAARILIVEDKNLIAEAIRATLEEAGYEVAGHAESGEAALELVKEESPDVILMDVQLAGEMDGIETAEEISKLCDTPLIYLTDFKDENTFAKAKRTNPASYLTKPYQPHDLLRAIDLAFYNASTGREAAREQGEVADTVFSLNNNLFVKENGVCYRVNPAEIQWIKAARSYFEIKTIKRTFTKTGNLSMFNQKFNHPSLVRISRSYIINIDLVVAKKGNLLIVDGEENEDLIISDSYRAEVEKHLHVI